MLSLGFSGTLTDFHRESLKDQNRRTLSHFLAHGSWDEQVLQRIAQQVAFHQIKAAALRELDPMFVILDDTVC
jgi:hypothetical protein